MLLNLEIRSYMIFVQKQKKKQDIAKSYQRCGIVV